VLFFRALFRFSCFAHTGWLPAIYRVASPARRLLHPIIVERTRTKQARFEAFDARDADQLSATSLQTAPARLDSKALRPTASEHDPPRCILGSQTRHNFLIKPLERRGWIKPRPYLYFCVRCRNAWRVNDPRNAIIPLDRNLEPIDGPLRCERIATFATGPCPAFSIAAVGRVHRPHCTRCGGWWSRVLQFIAGRA
jgi:hypothetical protein